MLGIASQSLNCEENDRVSCCPQCGVRTVDHHGSGSKTNAMEKISRESKDTYSFKMYVYKASQNI